MEEIKPISSLVNPSHHSNPNESLSEARTRLLTESLLPSDSYDSNGVYWADLNNKDMSKFVHSQNNRETMRELRSVGRMAKLDPLEPVRRYFSRYVITGMGLFVEGFVLFSIGNLQPLFAAVWPECWGKHPTVCSVNLISSVTYLEICGIIVGQVIVGIEGDWIGRKFGLVQDAIVMFIGVVLLTSVWGGSDLNGWVIGYTISLFFYGIGVGGEYPMTSTAALEQGPNGPAGTTDDRLHRGRNVVLAFLMQGWGQVFNQCVIMLLFVIFQGNTNQPTAGSTKVAQLTYRVSFAIIGVLHLWLVYYRVYKLKFTDNALRLAKKKLHTSGYDIASLKLVNSHYWHRLVATGFGWFVNDFFFYGNKIFAGVFISIIKPGASVFVTWEYNLINIAVSLVGYYLAAFLIDHKFYGRVRMQQVGFTFDFLLYLFGAIFFKQLQQPGTNIQIFQTMYFLSSFFNQFGPNCTTFLVAAEVYPASIRATAHGVSAAIGKLGALAPTILYNYIDNQTKFWIVPWFGLVGMIVTFLFLPDTTGLDLREQERYWLCVREGRESDYHGIAIHPRHLSWYERVVLKRNKYYDPEADKEQKIEELRILYESSLIAREDPSMHDDEHAFISEDVATFFEKEGIDSRVALQRKKARDLARDSPKVSMKANLEPLEKEE